MVVSVRHSVLIRRYGIFCEKLYINYVDLLLLYELLCYQYVYFVQKRPFRIDLTLFCFFSLFFSLQHLVVRSTFTSICIYILESLYVIFENTISITIHHSTTLPLIDPHQRKQLRHLRITINSTTSQSRTFQF